MARKKVLLGHLNSNGDCLFATVIARQIKEVDFPGCHLTWAVNRRCEQTVRLNPYVDQVWIIETEKTTTSAAEWQAFESQVAEKQARGEFDAVFLTQIIEDNWYNYDGGIRSSTYNNYARKITVSHQPVIRLSDEEIENVRRFAAENELAKYNRVVMVECAPSSFVAALNPDSAREMAAELIHENPDAAFILSSNLRIESGLPNIVDASCLSFRENAELTKYCDLFVGCASGLSWLATTDWAKKLDMILIVAEDNYVFPSMVYDHENLGLSTAHLIEIKSDADAIGKLKQCVQSIWANDFDSARKQFHEQTRMKNYNYICQQVELALGKRQFKEFFQFLQKNVARNGAQMLFTKQFSRIVRHTQRIFINKILRTLRLKKAVSA